MKRFYLLIIIGLMGVIVNAQDAFLVKEFKELNQHYDELESFSLDFEMQYFDLNGSALMVQTGSVTHSKDLHYSKVGERISLVTKENYIAVNTDGRFIVYNELKTSDKKDQEIPEEGNLNISTMLDSLWAAQKNLSFKTIQSKPGTLRVFISDSDNPYFDAYEVLINTEKNQLLEFTYHIRPTEEDEQLGKIRITYANENNRPKLNAEVFKVKYYMKNNKNERVASERFASYELIDQTKISAAYD